MNSSSKKLIAIFSPFLNPVGVKRATFGLAKEFSKSGYQIDMLSVHKEWDDLEFLENMRLIKLSNIFNSFPTTGYIIFRLVSIFIAVRTIFTISSYLKKNKPGVLFASMMPAVAWLGLKISGQKSSTKLVVSIQGYPVNNSFRRSLWKRVFKDSQDVIAESKSLKDKLVDMIGSDNNLNYIYNPHFENQDDFYTYSNSAEEEYDFILGLGRLTKQKNFKLLIHAFSGLNNISNLGLLIIGDGEEKGSLEKLIGKLGLSSRVKLLGEIKNPLSYVEKAKILVIPSLWEGLPRVAVEAQALKTPIISSCEEGGLGEILMNGDAGQITKKNDPIEMKNAIEKYIQDEGLAKDHAKLAYDNLNRFSLSSSSKKYLDIFSRY
ncbi:MAG: glycosyltransferase [Chloroflexota bacterium]|nr:glycosyltransferase [Chloroflexota bacterium]